MLLTLGHSSSKSHFSNPKELYQSLYRKTSQDPTSIDEPKLFDNLLTIISKNPALRTPQDEEIICKALRSIKIFLDLKKEEVDYDNFLIQSFNAMEYEHFNPAEAVFHLGDKGDKFFIILKGSVDVYIPKTQEEFLQDSKNSEKRNNNKSSPRVRGSHFLSIETASNKRTSKKTGTLSPQPPRKSEYLTPFDFGSDSINLHGNPSLIVKSMKSQRGSGVVIDSPRVMPIFPEKNSMYMENGICKFKHVRTMGPGTYFGEISLTSNLNRGATIIAAEDLHVLSYNKAAYKQGCKNVENSLRMKWRFFSELLDGTTKEALTKFCYTFKEKNLKYNQRIFGEGDQPQEVYVIRQGEVQVVRQQVMEEEDQNSSLKYLKKPKKVVEKKIVNLGPFTFFGEAEALSQNPYDYTAISTTKDTVVYSTSIQEFNMLRMSHADVIKKILRKHKAKMEHWNSMSLNTLKTEKPDKNDKPDEVIIITETGDASNKSISSERAWNRYFNFHSSKPFEKKIRKTPSGEDMNRIQGIVPNSSTLPTTESYQSLGRLSPDAQVQAMSMPGTDKIRVKSEGKTRIENAKIYHKIMANNLMATDNTKMEKFFPSKRDLKREESLQLQRERSKEEKLIKFSETYYDGDYDLDTPKSMVMQEYARRRMKVNARKQRDIESREGSQHFLPYEKDVMRMRLKSRGGGFVSIHRTNGSKSRSRDEDGGSLSIGRSVTERSNITNSNVMQVKTDASIHKIDRKHQNLVEITDEVVQEGDGTLRIDLKKILYSNGNGNFEPYSSTSRNGYTDMSFDSSQKKFMHKKFQSTINASDMSPGKMRKSGNMAQALPVNTFPLIDMSSGSPKSGGLAISRTTSGDKQNMLEPSFTKLSEKKSKMMIQSKHNMFRSKPKKVHIQYSHYIPATVRDLSGMGVKNK